ncbi:scavenger receptor class F member 1-like [Pantherophis guttatus]|uniref:Scavenger receptor class F member 1-like n=1 Tax=Pantherophis guttatus TaxID=94885 RepID=A0ABM3ZPU8_PANGU|nr:scavenger receptor class F member 1-like [Pantherophis guttatus]
MAASLFLKASIVGAPTTSGGEPFHWLIVLMVKKFLLSSRLDFYFISFHPLRLVLPSALPEGSVLPGAAALHPSPFAIPRTSSIAKGKRPSVSFAEGTHFGPQSPRAPPEALNPAWKPTASESSVQGAPPLQVNRPTGASCHSLGRSCYENVAPAAWEDSGWAPAGHHPSSHRSWAGGSQHLVQRAEPSEADPVETCVHEPSITTIYVTVGQARRGSEDPPPAAQRHQESGQEEAAWPTSLQKLPWKALDAAKGTSRKMAPEEPSMAEDQGLLAPDEPMEGGGSSGSLEA